MATRFSPNARGKIPSAIGDLQKRVSKLEPVNSVGVVTTVHPNGTSRTVRTGLLGNRTRAQSSAPRYR